MADKKTPRDPSVDHASCSICGGTSTCGPHGSMTAPKCDKCKEGTTFKIDEKCKTLNPGSIYVMPFKSLPSLRHLKVQKWTTKLAVGKTSPFTVNNIPYVSIAPWTTNSIPHAKIQPFTVEAIPHVNIGPWTTNDVPWSKVTDSTFVFTVDQDPVDPVCSGPILLLGNGIGYNRSRTILAKVSQEELFGDTECPECPVTYHMHINRLTEQPIFLRDTNGKNENTNSR